MPRAEDAYAVLGGAIPVRLGGGRVVRNLTSQDDDAEFAAEDRAKWAAEKRVQRERKAREEPAAPPEKVDGRKTPEARARGLARVREWRKVRV